MKDYLVNWLTLVTDYINPVLRTPFWQKWHYVVVHGIRVLHADFLSFRTNRDYEAFYTGQVASLEKLLQTVFDNTGILIQPNVDDEGYMLCGPIGTGNPMCGPVSDLDNPMAVPLSDITTNYAHDFTVRIPDALNGVINEDELCGHVNAHKHLNATYNLEYYN